MGVGGYGQYTLADERLCFKIPPCVPYGEAVTVPFAACTAYLGLFSKTYLNIDQKRGPDNSVLIWGGSCKSRVLHLNKWIFFIHLSDRGLACVG